MFFGFKNSAEKQSEKRRKLSKMKEEISEIWSGEAQGDNFDVNGSYTGNPTDSGTPVQDADDL